MTAAQPPTVTIIIVAVARVAKTVFVAIAVTTTAAVYEVLSQGRASILSVVVRHSGRRDGRDHSHRRDHWC